MIILKILLLMMMMMMMHHHPLALVAHLKEKKFDP
jgi:hypothetical protein